MLTTVEYKDGQLTILDQTFLPNTVEYKQLNTAESVFNAIKSLEVRGAPLIGVTAAYGVLVGIQDFKDEPNIKQKVEELCLYLASARPTAVNLSWALNRMLEKAQTISDPLQVFTALEAEACAIHQEDTAINKRIGEHTYELIKDLVHENTLTVLTYCNAGALATTGYGTATSVMYLLKEAGVELRVFVCETRPLLQGARLTALELVEAGIDATLITDNMAATVLSKGIIDFVVVGADRVAANGDVANKIGTLGISLLAQHYQVPFYVACPSPTFDKDTPNGNAIVIEEREGEEITILAGTRLAPQNIKTINPAFDVTPAQYITAVITENGRLESR